MKQSHLEVITNRLAEAKSAIAIVSDLDETLCNEYGFDPLTNNHIPIIRPEVVQEAQGQDLLVATARRADNPGLREVWTSGLVCEDKPVIAENGGVIVLWKNGKTESIDLISQEKLTQLAEVKELVATPNMLEVPTGMQLICKAGRTMIVLAIQDAKGNKPHAMQHVLADQLNQILPPGELRAVDGNTSVTVQHSRVHKASGHVEYLRMQGEGREGIFVVAMGDGENDKENLAAADFSIGFSDVVSGVVDVMVPDGANSAAEVLRAIKDGSKR